MDIALLGGGGLMLLIGWVWIMIAAFSESPLWAIAIFFISPIGAVYGFLKWEELKVPTILYLVGLVLFIIGKSI